MNKSKVGKYTIEYINSTEFKNLRNEIFNAKIYDIQINSLTPRILDLGAHIGLSTLFFKSKYPNSKLLSVEPNPILFKLLNSNLKTNGIDGVTTLNIAIDTHTGQKDFFIDSLEDPWYSTGGFNVGSWQGTQITKKITVKTIALEDVVENKPVDLLKMDIEGAEIPVLKNLDPSNFNLIKNLIVEYHPIKKNYFKTLNRILKNNFKVLKYIQNNHITNKPDDNKLCIIQASNI